MAVSHSDLTEVGSNLWFTNMSSKWYIRKFRPMSL
jgi:hypothetical protein